MFTYLLTCLHLFALNPLYSFCLRLLHTFCFRAQELCESRGGRAGLPSLISLVSADVKQHFTNILVLNPSCSFCFSFSLPFCLTFLAPLLFQACRKAERQVWHSLPGDSPGKMKVGREGDVTLVAATSPDHTAEEEGEDHGQDLSMVNSIEHYDRRQKLNRNHVAPLTL